VGRYDSAMLLQRIEQQFIESADLKYQCAQSLAPRVEMAVMAVMACVTSGGKVLTCGTGAGAAMAQSFAAAFLNRFERERPELAAMALSADAALLTSIAADIDVPSVFARPVRALGTPGDVLLIVARTGEEPHWTEAVKAAHSRDMTVVALTDARGGALKQALSDIDVHIAVPHESPARVHEVQQLVLHCLCDGVDAQLLGLPENHFSQTE
jgi:D-sedoheptulose 7-phosphate isomerase